MYLHLRASCASTTLFSAIYVICMCQPTFRRLSDAFLWLRTSPLPLIFSQTSATICTEFHTIWTNKRRFPPSTPVSHEKYPHWRESLRDWTTRGRGPDTTCSRSPASTRGELRALHKNTNKNNDSRWLNETVHMCRHHMINLMVHEHVVLGVGTHIRASERSHSTLNITLPSNEKKGGLIGSTKHDKKTTARSLCDACPVKLPRPITLKRQAMGGGGGGTRRTD